MKTVPMEMRRLEEQIATTGVARPERLPQRFEMWRRQQEKTHSA